MEGIPWLTPELQAELIAYSEDELDFQNPLEACGIILEVAGKAILIPSENCSPMPQQHFTLHPSVWQQALEGKCLAIFHSHPISTADRRLSFSDLAMSNQFKAPVLMWHVDDIWDYYDPLNPNPYPLQSKAQQVDELEFYLGWGWDWGRVCCGRLIYHYYLGRLGIELAMPTTSAHGKEVLAKGWNKYQESLIENGFVEVEDLQDNDIVLISLICENAHHGAIVVDAAEETLLHITNPEDFSKLERWHSDLKAKTKSVWRHPSFA
jgi:proteasome lid subunit RPN8/RPN11